MRLVAISADTPEESRALADELSIGFHLLHDADLAVADAYGVAMAEDEIAIPAVFVLDREGRIRWRKVGESMIDRPSIERILEHVDALIAEAD